MGCITLAFFKNEVGIIYGGKSSFDNQGKKTLAGWELLGMQIFGSICIMAWSGLISAFFFFISKKLNYLRLSEMDEILGGDLHYFGPIVFDGKLSDYDLALGLEEKVLMFNIDTKENESVEEALLKVGLSTHRAV